MIQKKLDMTYFIKSLLEIEKLKLLLFDNDQYALFEHIPKPLLFEKGQILDNQQGENGQGNDLLMTHNSSFWTSKNQKVQEHDFNEALMRIKKKENPDVIDERLIKIIEDFSS